MTPAQFAKQLEKQKVIIGKRRDVLRELVSDAEELRDECSEALDALEFAIDALSRLS